MEGPKTSVLIKMLIFWAFFRNIRCLEKVHLSKLRDFFLIKNITTLHIFLQDPYQFSFVQDQKMLDQE